MKSTKFLFILLGLFLAGCNEQDFAKDDGNVDHKGPEVSVSEMLLEDKDPSESSLQKSFIKQLQFDRVHFGFDQSVLSKQDEQYLLKVVDYLKVNLDLRVEIEGNCDSRGSKDYNIALGERRANVVANFLKKNGIAEHRINAVSFGSRVLVEGDSEEAYSQNRVAIVVVK